MYCCAACIFLVSFDAEDDDIETMPHVFQEI